MVDEEIDSLVDVPLHIGLGEDALGGPAVLHVLEQRDLQLVSQNLRRKSTYTFLSFCQSCAAILLIKRFCSNLRADVTSCHVPARLHSSLARSCLSFTNSDCLGQRLLSLDSTACFKLYE